MRIQIENPSSAGSSLTNNTIETLKLVFEYCESHPSTIFSLQTVIENAGMKWRNARTIFPLMRNLRFVNYEKYTNLNTDYFFTSRGKTYMNAVILESEESSSIDVLKHLQWVKFSLVRGGLNSLVNDESCKYQWILRRTMEFLQLYSKIDKFEFAYLVYAEKTGIPLNSQSFAESIESYRKNTLIFDVVVVVRNDRDAKSSTKEEDIGFLTSYTYVINILEQAGIVEKEDGYFFLNKNALDDVADILKGTYDEKSR